VTIRTVAEDAGVSVSAVSKVLRDAYGVSDTQAARLLTERIKGAKAPSTSWSRRGWWHERAPVPASTRRTCRRLTHI
jgi:hypothetical protein